MKHRSSTQRATFGNSSLTSMPAWPNFTETELKEKELLSEERYRALRAEQEDVKRHRYLRKPS